MVTQETSFSLITAPLAHCDRRALSQAWYSALHLEKTHACASASQRTGNGSGARALGPLRSAATISPARQGPAAPLARQIGKAVPAGGSDGGSGERRSARSSLARKIERTFLAPATCTKSAAFRLGQGGGRVQILIRQRGEDVHLVALCAPAAKDVVARALAQARYALCARGMNLHADVRALPK